MNARKIIEASNKNLKSNLETLSDIKETLGEDTFLRILRQLTPQEKLSIGQVPASNDDIEKPAEKDPLLAKANYALKLLEYLQNSLKGVEDNPKLWIESLKKNYGPIEELMKDNDHLHKIFSRDVDLGRMEQEQKEIEFLQELVRRISKARDNAQLEMFLEPFFEKYKDLKIRSMIKLTQKRHEEEIALFLNLQRELTLLKQEWANPNAGGAPAKKTAEIYRKLSEELPKELESKYGDKTLPKHIKQFFKKNKDSFKPIAKPEILLNLVDRVLKFLQQQKTISNRFIQTRAILVKKIEKMILHKKDAIEKEIEKIQKNLAHFIHQLDTFEDLSSEFVESATTLEGLFVSLIRIISHKMLLSHEMISQIGNNSNQDQSKVVILQNVKRYKELNTQAKKIFNKIKDMEGVVNNRFNLSMSVLKKLRLAS